MSKWLKGEEIRHQVAIAGRVTDTQTGKAIAGARVSLDTGPETITATDGHFHFLDLPAGKYTLVASLPGARTSYGPAQKTVTVKWAEPGKFAIADLALPPLTGQAKEPAPPAQAGGKKRSESQSLPGPASGAKRRRSKKSRE